VFATALDWPGWCRRGRGEEAALAVLLDYEDRYGAVVGPGFEPGPVEVVGRVPGTRTTDFGAPGARGPWDDEPLTPAAADRLVGLLEASWRYFDDRDRDAIVDHVREAERAYGAKVGQRVPPRTAWSHQRAVLAGALRAATDAGAWPVGYAIRRCAWHVLDHAWEIEDKSH
jgi:hypothetical protein